MFLTDKIVLVVLGLALVSAPILSGRSFAGYSIVPGFAVRYFKYVFIVGALAVFAVQIYWSAVQHIVWQADPISRYLLPPYQSYEYFFSYIGKRFFAPWLISLLAAILIPRIAERFNKKYRERFFYNEEFGLMRLGIFFVGYPGFVFYIVSVLLFGILLSTFYLLLSWGRASFYYLWMPLAIGTVLLVSFLLPPTVINSFLP